MSGTDDAAWAKTLYVPGDNAHVGLHAAAVHEAYGLPVHVAVPAAVGGTVSLAPEPATTRKAD